MPAISFKAGIDLVKGGIPAGRAAGEAYVRDRYHQPADAFAPQWDHSGMVQDLSILFDLGAQLANSRAWPDCKPGSEFKAARHKTAAARR